MRLIVKKKNYDLDITYIIYELKFVITLNIMLKKLVNKSERK